jgi:hypothetical protein
MRERGLRGVTISAVADMMKANGVAPGSRRDSVMVRAWKAEQETLRELPPGVVELAQNFAKTVWEIALETALQLEIQRGGMEEQPPRTRKPKRQAESPARLNLLQKGIEALLRKDANDPFVRAPTATEIFRKLPTKLAALTDEGHISRDLLAIAKHSPTIIRLADERWWRRDRRLPPEHVESARIVRGYERRGTPISRERTANEAKRNDVVAVLLKAGRGMNHWEIAASLGIPTGERKRFYQMLRNHPRGKPENVRFQYEDGIYTIVPKVGKTSS